MRQQPLEQQKQVPDALAPSLANARKILRRAVQKGTVTWTKRLAHRCSLHVINIVDVVRVVSTGTIVHGNRFDAKNDAWRYELVGLAEGRKLKVDVLLDRKQDFDECPAITIVTASWWKGRARTSKE